MNRTLALYAREWRKVGTFHNGGLKVRNDIGVHSSQFDVKILTLKRRRRKRRDASYRKRVRLKGQTRKARMSSDYKLVQTSPPRRLEWHDNDKRTSSTFLFLYVGRDYLTRERGRETEKSHWRGHRKQKFPSSCQLWNRRSFRLVVDLTTDRRKGTGEIMGERGFNRVVMETEMPQWRRMMTRVAYECSEQWHGYHHNLNDGDDHMPWWWGSWTCNGCPNLDFFPVIVMWIGAWKYRTAPS